MNTLLVFAALIYLVGHLRIDAGITKNVQFVLALAGLLLWALACLRVVDIPACLR